MHHIDNTIASCAKNHINHLLYTVHPCGIYIAVSIHVRIPCNRHTDDVEAFGSYVIDYLLRRDRLSPCCLPCLCAFAEVYPCGCVDIRISFESVSEVITDSKVLHKCECILKWVTLICLVTFLCHVNDLSESTRRNGYCTLTCSTLVLGNTNLSICGVQSVSISSMVGQSEPGVVT